MANPKKLESIIVGLARRSLQQEAQVIAGLSERLNQSFEEVVLLIGGMPSGAKLITTGMGKAGIIAARIASSFSSIGMPSFFLHPSEALHGDIGRVDSDDVVLIFSNSGNTAELSRLIPILKRRAKAVISILGSADSQVGSLSDHVIDYGLVKELGDFGGLPTVSLTAMNCIGNALLVAAAQQRGFSRERFAEFHPGGSLGRALLPVSEVMRKGELHCKVSQELPVKEVIHRITATKRRPGAASIVDGEGKLAGIFTDGDLRRCLEKGSAFLDLPVSEVMGRHPKIVNQRALSDEALRLMNEFQIDQVVVVDEEQCPVGMVDIQDLIVAG
ncbi:MAG: KpsF/GutQ family sugar-phosphate isomerase [Proteobacteria bacterium]|nr:MAG: KpsF/GutQ family sugar-phosphate isomerase [Pseudomonadota bacterium]